MSSDPIKVSVIIPAYNVEQYVAAALDTIVGQSLQELEILCVDDGSTDATGEILKQYAEGDSRIRIMTQANAGQGAARNRALEQARGEYVYFMDADDLLEREALAQLWQRCREERLDVLFFSGQSFYDSPELEQENPWYATAYHRKGSYPGVCTGPALFVQMREQKDYYASPCLMLCRRAFLMQQQIRFPEGVRHEDECFAYAINLLSQRSRCIPQVYFHRRIRALSSQTGATAARDVQAYFDLFWLMDELLHRNAPALQEQELEAFRRYQYGILNSARNACLRTEETWEPEGGRLFPLLVTDWVTLRRSLDQTTKRSNELTQRLNERIGRNKELNENLRLAQERSREKSGEIMDLKARLAAQRERAATLRSRLKAQQAENEKLQRKLEQQKQQSKEDKAALKKVRASSAYRAGRVLTWPARKLRRLTGGKK